MAALPMRGQINSLNASVAGGVLLYEIARQTMQLKARKCGRTKRKRRERTMAENRYNVDDILREVRENRDRA